MNIIPQEKLHIEELLGELKVGCTIVYPTETCYGLGCDATNDRAVEKIFAIKQRQKEKSVLVLMADVGMAMQYVEWTPMLEKIARHYWPGALTVVVPVKPEHDLAAGVVRDDGTIAFRITNHYFAEELVRNFGKPLVSTSANIAAMDNPYDIETVINMFEYAENQPDIVIDGGALQERAPSTIIKVTGQHIEVVRQGDVVVDHAILLG